MGKGSKRRRQQVTEKTMAGNWALAFPSKNWCPNCGVTIADNEKECDDCRKIFETYLKDSYN